MPTWSEILAELKELHETENIIPVDPIRRKYLKLLNEHTKRDVILYASRWTQQSGEIPPGLLGIREDDIQGLMEVTHKLKNNKLDLIIHSPGGSPETTEMMVKYIREKYSSIRAIIPQGAMSAATILACCADEIIMGKHSYLGPIDPQMIYTTRSGGVQSSPAQAILDQFSKAWKECKIEPKKLNVWMPILSQINPALLVQCENAIELAELLASDFLEKYMFKEEEDAEKKAKDVARKLSDHKKFRSHSRHINREMSKKIGLKVKNLEDDQTLQDLVLSVFHATTHTFGTTGTVKIIENHLGRAYIQLLQTMSVPVPVTKE
ncbi:hypothetical protein ES705_23691 [subsurface metagenome]